MVLRFIPDDSTINFVGVRKFAYLFSALLVLASVGLVMTKGLNFGIDFVGGTAIEIRVPETPDLAKLRGALNDLKLGAVSIQEFGEKDDLLIRLPEQEAAIGAETLPDGTVVDPNKKAIEAVKAELDGFFKEAGAVEYRRIEFVGPQVGKELKLKGLYAFLASLAAMLVYIWFRFEWQFGVAALVALAHDSLATIGLFALTQMEFNLSTVAAILMVAGYSINDTVVVFDRIRENLRKYKKKPLFELFNLSINETLSRTIMTSFTTVLALVALYLFGGEVIRGFVYALIFGIGVGTYSSIYVASPILLLMNVRGGRVDSGSADSQDEATA
ncbi:MAG: protein translocase subunit SecF [Alphaproteobacteria bacterium]|nr:protein translocase subunit SecF [Alphaproteobacteria bacterium]